MRASARVRTTASPTNCSRRCVRNSVVMSKPRADRYAVLVIMGVSGCGKTTIAELLSRELGWNYRDGDEFHPKSNVEKMHSGTPLTDDDRWPWLKAIAAWIDDKRQAGQRGIVTCSALKKSY